MDSHTLSQKAETAAKDLRKAIGECDGDEASVLVAFINEIGPIVDGWQMRVDELVGDDEE